MVKMEKKGFLIICLVLIILIFIGCKPTKTDGPSEVNYRTGTQGLVLEFPVDTPNQIYEGDQNIRFSIDVRNKGAFPQSDELMDTIGHLWIGGYDSNLLTISPVPPANIDEGVDLSGEELEGVSPYNLNGGHTTTEFQINANPLPKGTSYYKPNLIFTASYLYKTLASPMICIDPEPRSTRIREKVCTIQQSMSLGSQGAPVSVSKIEEDVTGTDFLFKIYIDNVGGGLIIPESRVDENPNQGYDWKELNKVKIDEVSIGNTQNMMVCRPIVGSDVQLIDGKGYIFCRLAKTVVEGKSYETPLNVKLSYGYTTSAQKTIEVFEVVSFN